MDNIIINSMNAGNLGLLESSINSKEFNDTSTYKAGLQQQDSIELINRFKTEINNLKNEYNTTFDKGTFSRAITVTPSDFEESIYKELSKLFDIKY